jgi:colanic acid biosynthesis protein WcaH
MLNENIYKVVINSAPLISIDFIAKQNNKVLLGRRRNKPAKGYFFTPGGRINKNETIQKAMIRIIKNELNIKLNKKIKFIGVFEHFYKDSIFNDVSTHYVNLAYEIEIDDIINLPNDQHDLYQWFSIEELLINKKVHKNVKDYFKD